MYSKEEFKNKSHYSLDSGAASSAKKCNRHSQRENDPDMEEIRRLQEEYNREEREM